MTREIENVTQMLYDLANSTPARELARALSRYNHSRTSTSFGAALAGFGAGVLVGLLFAPKSGRELRDELGGRMTEMKEGLSRPEHETH
jgi:hypothetical protein